MLPKFIGGTTAYKQGPSVNGYHLAHFISEGDVSFILLFFLSGGCFVEVVAEQFIFHLKFLLLDKIGG